MQPFDGRSSRRQFLTGFAGLTTGLVLSRGAVAQTPTPSAKPHRIDVHCHLVPPAYLAFLKVNYPDNLPSGMPDRQAALNDNGRRCDAASPKVSVSARQHRGKEQVLL